MTTARRALWLAQTLRPDVSHAVAFGVTLTGPLDTDRFLADVEAVFAHVGWADVCLPGRPGDEESVPTPAPAGTGRPVVELVDLSGEPEPAAVSTERAERLVSSPDGARLDVPLARGELHRLGPARHRWVVRLHHVLTDGAGALRVMAHVAEVHAGRARARDLDVPGDTELAEADAAYAASSRHQADARHWAGVLERHEPTFLTGGAPGSVSSELVRVERPVGAHRSPGAGELVAALATFCARWLDTADVGLALPVAARTSALRRRALQPQSNVVPLWLPGVGDLDAGEASRLARTAVTGALRRQLLRREEMYRDHGAAEPGVVVNLLPATPATEIGELRWELEVLRTGPVGDVAVTVHGADAGGARAVSWEAPAARVDAAGLAGLAERFDRHLAAFLTELDGGPVVPADSVFLPDEWERYRARSGPPAPPYTPLAAVLEESAAEDPRADAVLDGRGALDRSALLALADHHAGLLDRAGVRPGDPVAVCVPRSVESVLAFWAVVRAGAVWVPVDPTAPAARTADVLSRAGVRVGLTASPGDGEGDGGRGGNGGGPPAPAGGDGVTWIAVDRGAPTTGPVGPARAPGLDRGPGDRAYVLFTSGSTGRPKGVVMPHRGLPALTAEIRRSYALGPGDRMLHASSPTFDSGLVEVLSAAVTGAALVVAPVDVRGGEPLARLVRDAGVTHLVVTPSVLDTVPVETARGLTQVVLGGEAVPSALVARWGDRVPLRNAYGPTETRCSINFSGPLDPGAPVTVGPPMTGVTEAVLDRHGRPQPPGAIGVLHASGPQVADGYLAEPELTAEVFLPSTLGGGPVMYRTGDLATWTPDGDLRVLGRRDGQVKLRGLRIELDEVDAALAALPGISNSATVLGRLPSGSTGLVSYVVPAEAGATSSEELRAGLAERLPAYMLPSATVTVDELPRTHNGKLDVAALPPVRAGAPGTARPPSGEREEALCAAVARTLSLDSVDPDSSFPGLGGDSLGAVRLVQDLEDAGWRCPAVERLLAGVELGAVAPALERVTATRDETTGGRSTDPVGGDVPLGPAQRTVSRTPGDPDAQLIRVAWVPGPEARPTAAAIAEVVRVQLSRHPVLGASFPDTPDGPVLRLAADRTVDELVTTRTHTGATDRDALHAVVRDLEAALDVRSGPPMLVRVLTDGDQRVRAVVAVLHHVAVDGISLAVLAKEAAAVLTGADPGPAPTTRLDRHLLDLAATPPADAEPPSLPDRAWTLDGVDPLAVTDRRALHTTVTLDAAEAEALREHAARAHVTPFTAVRAALAATLAEVTGDALLASAIPVSGRPRGWEGVVGDFVLSALLPLDRAATPAEAALAEQRARATAESGVAMEALLDRLGRPTREGACFPVPVCVGWAPAVGGDGGDRDGGGVGGTAHVYPPERTRWLLQLDVSPLPAGSIRLLFTHAAGGLRPDRVERLGEALARRLRGGPTS